MYWNGQLSFAHTSNRHPFCSVTCSERKVPFIHNTLSFSYQPTKWLCLVSGGTLCNSVLLPKSTKQQGFTTLHFRYSYQMKYISQHFIVFILETHLQMAQQNNACCSTYIFSQNPSQGNLFFQRGQTFNISRVVKY